MTLIRINSAAKTSPWQLHAFTALIALVLAGCSEQDAPNLSSGIEPEQPAEGGSARSAEARARQARNAFVEEVETLLQQASQRIETLEELAEDEQGPARQETNKQIKELLDRHDRVVDQLSKLKAAELPRWGSHHDQVQRAVGDLRGELEESK